MSDERLRWLEPPALRGRERFLEAFARQPIALAE